jgi:hypothetical protein
LIYDLDNFNSPVTGGLPRRVDCRRRHGDRDVYDYRHPRFDRRCCGRVAKGIRHTMKTFLACTILIELLTIGVEVVSLYL